MKLKVLGSSSAGNGYILQGESEALILEAGMPVSMVRRYVDDFRQICGCLVSHRHGDHSKYIADYIKAGIKIYTSPDVGDAFIDNGGAIDGDMWDFFMRKGTTSIGGFSVMPVSANHDVPCMAFFVYHKEMGRLAFITDSHDFNYTLEGVNHLMIECNWSEEGITKAVEEGRTPWFVAQRVRKTHMGIHDAIEYIREDVQIETLKNIVMVHLSHENADPNKFTEEMLKAFQKPTYVAEEGLVVELNK